MSETKVYIEDFDNVDVQDNGYKKLNSIFLLISDVKEKILNIKNNFIYTLAQGTICISLFGFLIEGYVLFITKLSDHVVETMVLLFYIQTGAILLGCLTIIYLYYIIFNDVFLKLKNLELIESNGFLIFIRVCSY